MEIEANCTISAVRIRVVAAVAGSMVVGIYKYNPSDSSWTLIEQSDPSTPFDLGVVATTSVNLTNAVSVSPGIYAACVLASSAATIYHSDFKSASTYFGSSPTISTTDYKSGITAGAVGYVADLSTLTPTFTATNFSQLPFTLFKVNA